MMMVIMKFNRSALIKELARLMVMMWKKESSERKDKCQMEIKTKRKGSSSSRPRKR